MADIRPYNSVSETLQVAEAKHREDLKFVKAAAAVFFVLIICLKVTESSNGVLTFFSVFYLLSLVLTLVGLYHNYHRLIELRQKAALSEAQTSKSTPSINPIPRTDSHVILNGNNQTIPSPPVVDENRRWLPISSSQISETGTEGVADGGQGMENSAKEQREAELQELEWNIQRPYRKPDSGAV